MQPIPSTRKLNNKAMQPNHGLLAENEAAGLSLQANMQPVYSTSLTLKQKYSLSAAPAQGPMSESHKNAEDDDSSPIGIPHEHTSEHINVNNQDNPPVVNSNTRNKSTFSKQLGSQESSVQSSSRQMRGTAKPKLGRGPSHTTYGAKMSSLTDQDVQSALKIRRNKKNLTAAQAMGKTTGRWTDEEHQRFNEAIELFGKNWKKVTAYVATRISAQVRSHAQKVLKDYSPHSADRDDDDQDSKSALSEHNETLTLPKDHTMRTDEPQSAINRLDTLRKVSGDEGCLTTNLNHGHKRYRNTAENSIDVGQHNENFMSKIRVTHVECSELSQHVGKPPSESCIPQDAQSNFCVDGLKAELPEQMMDSRSNCIYMGSQIPIKKQSREQVQLIDLKAPSTPNFISIEARDSSRGTPARPSAHLTANSLRTMLTQQLQRNGVVNSPLVSLHADGGSNGLLASQAQLASLQSQQPHPFFAGSLTANSLTFAPKIFGVDTPPLQSAPGLMGLRTQGKGQACDKSVMIVRPKPIKATQDKISEIDPALSKVQDGLGNLKQKRLDLVNLIHAGVHASQAAQEPQFQKISQEFFDLQSVLSDVIQNFNIYLEGQQQGAQSQATAQTNSDIGLQVRLFEIDVITLETQIHKSSLVVNEYLRGQENLIPQPQAPAKTAQTDSTMMKEQVMAILKKFQSAQSDQDQSNRNPGDAQASDHRQNLARILGGAPAPARPQQHPGQSGKSTAPNTIIMGATNAITQHPAAVGQRSLTSILNELLSNSRIANERSGQLHSHRPSFDSQK